MKWLISYSKNEGGALSPPLLLMIVSILYYAAPVSSSRGVPFLPSIRSSRNAAKEAYAAHLETELEVTRRQLYTSQNTCTSLRKRCEDQRKETLRLMSSSAAATTSAEKDREANKEQLVQQEKEIERLQRKLQQETQQYHEQVEKLTLLEAEMKEIKKMRLQSNEAEVREYQEKLEQSQQTQTEYEKEIQLLTLKLEAAQLAAQEQRDGEEGSSLSVRAQELQALLQSVREKYSTVLNTAKAGGYDEAYQNEIEKEMDQSIQLALEKTLKAVEDEWETRYAEVETKLAKMSHHVESLENERDSALRKLEANISSSSASKVDEEELKEDLTLELTERLTKELTDQLTDQLTEQLKAELKETMAKKIEKKYKKKYKRMQQELEEQKSVSEQSSAELNEELRQKMEAEISAAREQCELDYKVKLAELQKQSDERVQVEKERMRKLVRALLEREAKHKREIKENASKKEAKKQKHKVSQSIDDNDADEMIQSAASLSSRKKKQSRKGVPRPSSF